MMKILYISNDFVGSKVHSHLTKAIDKLDVEQIVYCPVREGRLLGNNKFEGGHIQIIYSNCIRRWYKYVYHYKLYAVYKDMIKHIDLGQFELIHAATLFSDGGLAYKAKKQYGIPYIVAVRNTDINGFLDKAPNTWLAAKKILRSAEKIVFISHALMDKFCNHLVIKSILPDIKDKMVLIPNGIDDYYIDHIVPGQRCDKEHKVLYVGNFSQNKNVLRLCEAVWQLSKEEEFKDIKLTLVGGGGRNEDERVSLWIDNHKELISFMGPIYEKDKLCELFCAHSVFAMPSIHETFGLVYVESLSQNIPVVYTKGQGIDRLFPPSIGEAVNPLSVEDIKRAIKTIMQNKDKYSNEGIDFKMFRWNNIASNYVSIYKNIILKQ